MLKKFVDMVDKNSHYYNNYYRMKRNEFVAFLIIMRTPQKASKAADNCR